MKTNVEQHGKQKAFTIIELLTVMSIIVILFGLLVPAMNLVRRYAKDVKQSAQFHAIEAGIQMFHDDFQGYPDSTDTSGTTWLKYPGGMKLAEAMVGQDLLGFHPASIFDRNGADPCGVSLYPKPFNPDTDPAHLANLRIRKGPYATVEKINVVALLEYYNGARTDQGHDTYPERQLVIADEYPRVKSYSGKRIGMPILYYKANVSNVDFEWTKRATSIYNSDDNQKLVDLPLPWDQTKTHPMATTPPTGEKGPELFYTETQNSKIAVTKRPYNQDSYILMSAGFDGLYGTRDDMFNFEKE